MCNPESIFGFWIVKSENRKRTFRFIQFRKDRMGNKIINCRNDIYTGIKAIASIEDCNPQQNLAAS